MISHIAYVGLGSNLGDRRASLQRAVRLLGNVPGMTIQPGGVASLYETQPIGDDAMPPFLNSALRVAITLTPKQLMEAMLEIERLMGRKRQVRWESRVIDLDLLLYDEWVSKSLALNLPHPRMHERRFVLEPLAEIAADVVHPLLGGTIAGLAAAMRDAPDQGVVRIAGPEWVIAPRRHEGHEEKP